jgi:hypothetical protein
MKKGTNTKNVKIGYVAIYCTEDYGGRTLLDANNNLIYESKIECELDCQNDDGFVAIATLTWKESA